MQLTICPYTPADLPEMVKLFQETVRRVCVKDYTPVQIEAWVGKVDLARWEKTLAEHTTLLAFDGEALAGFGDIRRDGYLDRLYVRWDRQGQGVGTALCDRLETAGDFSRVFTEASITARGFFARRGYALKGEQTVFRRGVALTNYQMEKRL